MKQNFYSLIQIRVFLQPCLSSFDLLGLIFSLLSTTSCAALFRQVRASIISCNPFNSTQIYLDDLRECDNKDCECLCDISLVLFFISYFLQFWVWTIFVRCRV